METPQKVKARWLNKTGPWSGTTGTAWEGEVDVFFAGTERAFTGHVVVAKGRDGDWLARLPLGRMLPEVRAALNEELGSLNLMLGEPDDLLARNWVAGRGRTRDAAAEQAGLAAFVASSRGRGEEPADRIAKSREAAASLQAYWAKEAADRSRREAERVVAEARRELGARALRELERLDAEGLLDGSNALAGLRDIALALRGQEEPAAPAPPAAAS